MRAIITVGISASGKTTFAKEMEKEGWRNINRDDIRFNTVCPGTDWSTYKFTKEREKKVTDIQEADIRIYAGAGNNIVISDTNLNPKTRNRLIELCREVGYEIEIKDFPITYEEACKRDAYRCNGVGHNVIYKQYQQWLDYIGRRRYTPDPNKPKAVIVDVDGTIANHKGIRSPYEWDKVYFDDLRESILHLVEGIQSIYDVLIVSGRDGVCYNDTVHWLKDHWISYANLYMRKEGDFRKDTIIKEEIFWNEIADNYNVQMVIDDRPCVVRMWYEIGIPNVVSVANPYLEF